MFHLIGGQIVTYPENEDLRKVMDHITKAIIYINQAINNQEDLTRIYELQLTRKNLEMSQKIILFGLSET
jgi:hypothetical protein